MKFERIALVFAVAVVLGTFVTLSTVQGNENASRIAKLQASKRTATDILINGKQLVFSDDFSGSTLDENKWSTCYDWRRSSETGCTNQGNLEQEWYTRDQVAVKDGSLLITAKNEPTDVVLQNSIKTFQYQSGMISTGGGSANSTPHWTGTYGYYEARMKFGKGHGVWPAFWLLPADKSWPPEIDAMEFIGGKPDQILQTVHWQENNKPLESSQIIKGQDYSGSWHTYGVDWEPDKIEWYVDGVKTRSYSGPNIPNKPMEIILDLAIGGTLPSNADSSTPFPQGLQVDYVRVYQSKDQIRPSQY